MKRSTMKFLGTVCILGGLSAGFSGCTAFGPGADIAKEVPNHERTLLIADTYLKQGHTERAEALYASVLQSVPNSLEAKNGLATIARMTADPAKTQIAVATSSPSEPRKAAPKSAPVQIEVPTIEVASVEKVVGTVADDLLAESQEVASELPPQPKVDAPAPPAELPSTNDLAFLEPAPVLEEQAVADEGGEFFETAAAEDTEADGNFDIGAIVADSIEEEPASLAVSESDSAEESTEWRTPVQFAAAEIEEVPTSKWRSFGSGDKLSRDEAIERLMVAKDRLIADATDTSAWRSIDQLVASKETATKSLTVLTLGELPPACHADAVQRLRTLITTERDDELKAAAVLSLGGLGEAASPAVPVLQNIVLTGGEQSREAAIVSLACLGHEAESF